MRTPSGITSSTLQDPLKRNQPIYVMKIFQLRLGHKELNSELLLTRHDLLGQKSSNYKVVNSIDSKVYTHSSIKELPAKFSLEAARTKYVNDGTIGFYSKYLANFYHAPFGYDGKEFVSVEKMFPVKKAEMTGQQDLAPVICDETECEDKETW